MLDKSFRMEGFFLLGELLCGKLLKSRRHNIGVPAFEEYQVPGRLRAAVFFQGKINAVLLSGGRKCPDVVVGDLQVKKLLCCVSSAPLGSVSLWGAGGFCFSAPPKTSAWP